MKTKLFALPAVLILCFLAASQAPRQPITFEEEDVQLDSTNDGLIVSVNFSAEQIRPPQMGDLSVTLLDEQFRPVKTVSKQVVMLQPRQKENILIPAQMTPDRLPLYSVDIEFQGHTVHKRLTRPIDRQDIVLLGQDQLEAGSTGSIRVLVRNGATNEPVDQAVVTGRLLPAETDGKIDLFETKTDSCGSAEIAFNVPEDVKGDCTFIVELKSELGKEKIERPVTILAKNRIYLTSDKPVYQPGQLMHLRALVLRASDWKPVDGVPMVIEVADGKGNKVFKKSVKTSEYGIVSADFQLADEVNEGAYTISALLGDQRAEKVVTVKRYVLPKFKIEIKTGRDYYGPGEKITGTLDCNYFFGKPVSGGAVKISASCFDVGSHEFDTFEGKTDDDGSCSFSLTIPRKLVAQESFRGKAMVQLEAKVRDGADHEEEKYHMVYVAQEPIQLEVIPESGRVIAGVENTFYLVASYPDGSAATPELRVALRSDAGRKRIGEIETSTDEKGLATLQFDIPADVSGIFMDINAKDSQGNIASATRELETEKTEFPLLLRTDRSTYRVGDTMLVEIVCPSTARETIFVDLIKDDQTVLTKSIDLQETRTLPISLDQHLFGTVTVHAYRVLPNGEMAGDTRKVVVNRRDDLKISLRPDQEEYRPGDPANVAIKVTDDSGRGTQAALGIDVVDESVFSVVEKQPGLAKVFFTIEKELLEPKYEIHGFTLDQIVRLSVQDRDWMEKAARVSLAKSEDKPSYTLRVFTGESLLEEARRTVSTLANYLAGFDEELRKAGAVENVLYPRAKLADARMVVDPWGIAYQIASKDRTQIVRSAGPDHEFDTLDDIEARIRPRVVYERRFMPGGIRPMDALAFGRGMELQEHFFAADGEFPPPVGLGVFAGRRLPEARAEVVAEELARLRPAKKRAAVEVMEAELLALRDEDRVISLKGGTLSQPATLRERPKEIRVRRYFPELLYTNPSVVTDREGRANIRLTMADSITTWRMTALANSKAGQLGNGEAALRVFQQFFIDLDLPIALTKDDEVTVPVAIHNYLPRPQTVQVQLEPAHWFDLLEEERKKTVVIAANDVGKVDYRIRAKKLGKNRITVYGWSEEKEDAVAREVEVRPNGEERFITINGRLSDVATHELIFPSNAIPEASKILLRIYPGIFSQVVEGLDSMLRMPFGCFEQTSSICYPNILVLDYMRRTDQVTPEIEMKAREYINLGYQRLVTFEIEGGGFEVFGRPPANRVLSAYGLLEFADMNRVYPIDERIIERTQRWLVSQQQRDGSWQPDKNYAHAEMWRAIQNNPLLVTAFITWGLGESGYKGEALDKARSYLRKHIDEAKDSYTMAMVANAWASRDPDDPALADLLQKLRAKAVETRDTIHWPSQVSLSFAHGKVATIETTALATIAMIKSGHFPTEVGKALNYLIQQKDPHGTWHSTHATVLALKAMVLSLGNATEEMEGTVTIKLDGNPVGEVKITPENCDVVRLVSLGLIEEQGKHEVELELDGEGSVLYQIVGSYFVPWDEREKKDPLAISVDYDRTELQRNDTVTCRVTARNNSGRRAEMVILDVGIPPGFQVETHSLEDAVKAEKIAKYSMTGRQVTIYLRALDRDEVFTLEIPMKARLVIAAKSPESRIYEYYNPEVRGFDETEDLRVR